MTTRAKVVGGALLLLLGWWAYASSQTSAPTPTTPVQPEPGDGQITSSNLVFQGAQCVRVDFYASGKSTNTPVDAATCCADNPNFAACAQSGGTTDSSGADTFPTTLPPKTDN